VRAVRSSWPLFGSDKSGPIIESFACWISSIRSAPMLDLNAGIVKTPLAHADLFARSCDNFVRYCGVMLIMMWHHAHACDVVIIIVVAMPSYHCVVALLCCWN
jgi:hypothetical protein